MDIPLPILGSWFQYHDRSIITSLGPLERVVVADPQRWSILFFNPNAGTMSVNPDGFGAVEGALPVLNSTLPLIFDFPRFGGLVQLGWSAQTNPVGGTVICYEVLYMPPAMSEAVTIQDEE